MKLLTSVFVLFLVGCNANRIVSQQILSDGVLIAGKPDHYQLKQTIEILNTDSTVFAKIYRDANGEMVKSIGDSLKIRAFYPSYDIVIFDAKGADEKEVFVNGSWKSLKSNKGLTYLSWENFIKDTYLGLKETNALHLNKDGNVKVIKDYERLYFQVLEVDGDWLKVKCWDDCEGCPANKTIEGWVKWRNGKKLLVDLYYIC